MISGAMVAKLGDEFDVRELDRIAVKGKDEAVTVYEVLGARGTTDPAWLARARRFEDGLGLYRAQNFEQARAVFAANADDPVSAIYVERCDMFVAAPPGPAWDGVWRMKEK
jgi:adenylate cyclase